MTQIINQLSLDKNGIYLSAQEVIWEVNDYWLKPTKNKTIPGPVFPSRIMNDRTGVILLALNSQIYIVYFLRLLSFYSIVF
jgi:hypothetical protein